MKDYSDVYLLTKPYKCVAYGWDSDVFVDEQNPDVILKLYDPLTKEQVLEYYQIQKEFSRGILNEGGDIQIEVLNPLSTKEFRVMDTEDGVLVILPRIDGIPLSKYSEKNARAMIYEKVKQLMQQNGLPTTGGFEVKFENLMVLSDSGTIHVVITDIGSRIDECLKETGERMIA